MAEPDPRTDDVAPPTTIALDALAAHVGTVIGVSPWTAVEQSRIDLFAAATDDHQWIHVDPVRAAAGPFGVPVAHGFLTLSLIPTLAQQAFAVQGQTMGLNYGLDRVRFPAPLPAGARVRARLELLRVEPLAGPPAGAQLAMRVTVEREGADKPVCVAELLSRHFVG